MNLRACSSGTRIASLFTIALLALPAVASAADDTWNGASSAVWATPGNWAGGNVPGTGDKATFDGAGNGNVVIDLGSGVAIKSNVFDTAGAAAYTIGSGAVGSQTLALSDGGVIQMTSTVAQNQLFNSAITLGTATTSSYTFTNAASAQVLTLAGNITGGSGGTAGVKTLTVGATGAVTIHGIISNGGASKLSLIKTGIGTLTLTGANTYTGTTAISAGTLALSTGGSLATSSTVNFSGTGAFIVGSSVSQSLANITVANGVTGTVTGSGSLTLTGSPFVVGGTVAGQSQALDLSGLSSFTYNNNSGTFQVSSNFSGNGNATTGVVSLAASSIITASAFNVGTAGNGGNTPVTANRGTVNLGGSTTVNANSIQLGTTQGVGIMQYAAGVSNPVLVLRGADGTSAVNTLYVGYSGAGPNTLTTTNTLDLVTGIAGTSTLDAKVGTLIVAYHNRNTAAVGSPVLNSSFTMGAGTLSATTLVLGRTGTYGCGSLTSVNGTFTSGVSGLMKVGALTLGDRNITSGTENVTGTFNLNGGANLYAMTIQKGNDGAGTGSATRQFNWNDGTIHNYDASTDLTVSLGPTWTLASTGTHTFNIDGGRTGTVAAVLEGTGVLTKAGDGTLAFTGANTYSGLTTVNAGELDLNTTGSPAIAGHLTVNGGTAKLLQASQINSVKNLVVGGGTFDLQGYDQTLAGVQMTSGNITGNGGVLTLSTGNFEMQSGSVTAKLGGSVGLTKSGTGTVTLSGANTYTGSTSLAEGTLNAGVAETIGTAGPFGNPAAAVGSLLFSGGMLQYSAANQYDYSGRFSTAGSQPIKIDLNGQPVAFGTAIEGAGTTLTVTNSAGPGVLTLTGANTYDGLTTVNAGELDLNNAGGPALAGNLAVNGGTVKLMQSSQINDGKALVVGGGTFDLQGYDQTVAGVTMTGGSITGSGLLTLSAGNYDLRSGTVSAKLAGDAGLNKTTYGTVTLSGANAYSGVTTLSTGQLNLNHAQALGSGTFTLSGGTLDNTSGAPITNSNNNAQNWNGNFTFAGTTNLDLGAGAVTMNASAQVTVKANTLTVGGVISGSGYDLTKAGAGTLVLTGNNTYNGNTIVTTGTLQVGNGGTLGEGNIEVDAGGVLAFHKSGSYTMGNMIYNLGDQAGLITVQGGGTNNLTGDLSQFIGTITVSNATVLLNMDPGLPFGGLMVAEAGGTLGGTGAVTSAAMNPGSILSPGNSPGTLTVTDTLVLNGNTNEFQLVSPADYDQVVVYNQLMLTNNPILKLSFSTAFNPGDKFLLFQNGVLDKPANLFLDNPYYGGLHELVNGTEFYAVSGGITNNFALYYHASGLTPDGLGQDILLAAVPEPGTLSLLLLFGSTLLLRRKLLNK